MTKVITYGTYDLLHYGHIRLLERAKALGDYLIVGVTAEDFDKTRGKINVQQSLMERIEGVRATGLADEIIIEEYEGQKIDDIRRYHVDIFAIGSDWRGKFDYLNEYCKVVYLDRTEGVSSTQLRSEKHAIRLGLVGDASDLQKFRKESGYVNGAVISGVCGDDRNEFRKLLEKSDAMYILSHPDVHYQQIRRPGGREACALRVAHRAFCAGVRGTVRPGEGEKVRADGGHQDRLFDRLLPVTFAG